MRSQLVFAAEVLVQAYCGSLSPDGLVTASGGLV